MNWVKRLIRWILSKPEPECTPMVAAGQEHTVGLKSNGTVVAAGEYHTVGLKDDGTVVAAGLEVELAKWKASGIIGLKFISLADS